jgi:dTDP-4-dehydrorhamnose reductase
VRILITGGTGMLGRTLTRRWAGEHEIRSPGSRELDVRDPQAVEAALEGWRPQTVVHCAAHTKVDLCESEPQRAFALNEHGSAVLADACTRHGARLIAISTDYVFRGDLDRPYRESDTVGPLTVYGRSKLAGEEAVRTRCADHVIARVAWLYGPGGPSFLHTMRKLGAQPGPALRVVDDQIGNPTSTDTVADGLRHLLTHPLRGTLHLTCGGETTWCGFARAIFQHWHLPRQIESCSTAEFPRPAPRPPNSRLATGAWSGLGLPALPSWQDALASYAHDWPND